ncbi:unnamed protein product [Peronospora destructor]|uniref:Uncharacterized protein n=1 Tax=Peronospora destructor TaxID=86335 RepID=A0AAV0V1C1_9STRA|nr:unnamed protein product [Peronospora destructor]CAI5742976.1 unnamed protein product [Peronospora destructor]
MSSRSSELRVDSHNLYQHMTTGATTSAQDYIAEASSDTEPVCLDHIVIDLMKPSCTEDENGSNDCSSSVNQLTSTKLTKSVRWSTITVHEFGVGLGGSAVSNKGGPSIGLADTPEFTWMTRVGEMAECVDGVHRFSSNQRIRLLQAAGIPDGIITRHAREAKIILGSRRLSKISWSDSDLDESEEEEEETSKKVFCKRSADQAMLGHPCSVYLRRPCMIPINYV